MRIQRCSRRLSRPLVFKIALAGVCTLYAAFMLSVSTGISGQTRKNTSVGCNCHGNSPTAGVSVTITGPETLLVNQVGSYSVRITGGPAARAGTDIAASTGTLTPVSAGLKKLGSDLTHMLPAAFSAGAATFQFTYTAPATPGVQTLYANGNSVNFNGQNSGDQWNFAPNKTVLVVLASDVADWSSIPSSFALHQNYPNPFNPLTHLQFTIANLQFVSLNIYNIAGEEVATLVHEEKEPGSYAVPWNASEMPSGIYYYRLTAGEFSEVKKMVLAR